MTAIIRKNPDSRGDALLLLYALFIIMAVLVPSEDSTAASRPEKTLYATSFLSLTDQEQVKGLNRELSKILESYTTLNAPKIGCVPVTSKGKKYYRSIIVTDEQGLRAIKEREAEIGSRLRNAAQRLFGLAIQAKSWAYRLESPVALTRPRAIPLSNYDKTAMPGASGGKSKYMILVKKSKDLADADKYCRELGSRGVEVILAYPQKITGGPDGREIDAAPFCVFLKGFDDSALFFNTSREAKRYLKKNKAQLRKEIGKGLWQICDSAGYWQMIPRKKYNLLLGSFRLDQLPSPKEQLKPYIEALEERGLPFYLATANVSGRTYLRVVHAVPDELQLQIDMVQGRLAEELSDFSAEFGTDFGIRPQKVPQVDRLEVSRFTLDDLAASVPNGTSVTLNGSDAGRVRMAPDRSAADRPLALAPRMNGLPVNVGDLFGELFLPRILPLQQGLNANSLIGLKVIKVSLPGMGEHTCLAIEENYRAEHAPLADKLKANGKIIAYFVYQQHNELDLGRTARLAAEKEVMRREAEASGIERLEQEEASLRLASEAVEKMVLRRKYAQMQYIINDIGYSRHVHPVILNKKTVKSFSLVDEAVNSIDITDCPDLASSMKALMWTESSGNPRARSYRNARGPLQVTKNGYLHARRKFAELIRMSETAERKLGEGEGAGGEAFPLQGKRLLENAWRLVDPGASFKDAVLDPKLNTSMGILQFLVDYTFFSQRYVKAKTRKEDNFYYGYELKCKEKDYYCLEEENVLDPEIAAMASYNHGRYGVIKAIKRKGGEFVKALPGQTRRHLANYFITKLSLDERSLAEYKTYTSDNIVVKAPLKPARSGAQIKKLAQRY